MSRCITKRTHLVAIAKLQQQRVRQIPPCVHTGNRVRVVRNGNVMHGGGVRSVGVVHHLLERFSLRVDFVLRSADRT